MVFSQARLLPNLQVGAVADLCVERARVALHQAGYLFERIDAASLQQATTSGETYVTDDAFELFDESAVYVVVAIGEGTDDLSHNHPAGTCSIT